MKVGLTQFKTRVKENLTPITNKLFAAANKE